MEQKEPSKQLYTCLLRCIVCLRLLSETRHVEKKPGVLVNYNECPLHKERGIVVEWEPEELAPPTPEKEGGKP